MISGGAFSGPPKQGWSSDLGSRRSLRRLRQSRRWRPEWQSIMKTCLHISRSLRHLPPSAIPFVRYGLIRQVELLPLPGGIGEYALYRAEKLR
jgi:hypothetical protein